MTRAYSSDLRERVIGAVDGRPKMDSRFDYAASFSSSFWIA